MTDNERVLIDRLRQATADDHKAAEAALPILCSDLDVALYRRTLGRIYGLVLPWEQMVERQATGQLAEMVRERSRRALLAHDLAVLGETAAALPVASLPVFESEAALLGAMYVMEGSRLGGQLIARHVTNTLGDLGQQSVRYFSGFGEATGMMWIRFSALLRVNLPESDTEFAVHAAIAMFASFSAWMDGGKLLPVRELASSSLSASRTMETKSSES